MMWKSVEGYTAIASGEESFSPAKTPKTNKKCVILRKLAYRDVSMQAHELWTLTQLHKVIVLQNVLCHVLRMKDLSTPAPLHAKLHVPVSILQLYGLTVALKGLNSQCLDGGCRVTTGHPEPLAINTHRHTEHDEEIWIQQGLRLHQYTCLGGPSISGWTCLNLFAEFMHTFISFPNWTHCHWIRHSVFLTCSTTNPSYIMTE